MPNSCIIFPEMIRISEVISAQLICLNKAFVNFYIVLFLELYYWITEHLLPTGKCIIVIKAIANS